MSAKGLSAPVFSAPESRQWFKPLPGEDIAMRIESHQTGGTFSLTEIIVAPNSGPPLHIHHDADELLFVLEGTMDFLCDGRRFNTGPGGLVAVPRGTPHAFRNLSAAPTRMVVLLTPGGFEQFMHAMKDKPLSEVPAVAAGFGMEIVGPPISEGQGND